MKDLLKRYCLDNENDTGLLLLDMPTGSGKTHNVLLFIKDYLKQNHDKKIFFVTTLKKNLDDPYNKLLKNLESEPELKECVFRVLSNTEHAIKNFSDIKKKITIKEIRTSDEFKNFDALISAGVVKTEIYEDIERKFRHLIGKVLSRKFKTKSEKINAIKNDKDWQWVGELYPVVFSEEKRVFFITMKKLINKFDTIIEKSVRLYESPIFKNSIVFIDEFDATKKDIQDMIVRNGLNKGIDYIDLFRNIKICLDNQESMPSNIFDNIENKPNHKYALERNIKIFDEIDQKYHLLQHHKSIGFEQNKIVLFSDYTHNNYVTGSENVTSEYDKDKNINILQLVPETKSNRSLYEALDKIKGAISHFARFVTILANSYLKNKQQNKEVGKSYGEFTESHALDTILDSLHLQGESNRIIRDMAITYNNKHRKTKEDTDIKDDLFFYSSGFSHYDFSDDYSHDNTTIIRKFIFEETPESVLYTICSNSKVVGISATATFKTALGNYDIDYLKWKLGNKFISPTEDDKQRLQKDFEKQTEGFEKVKTIVELTNTSSKAKKIPNWSNIYQDNEIANKVHNITNGNNSYSYNEERYYKATLAFKQFLDNNIQSYLALFNKSLKKNDDDFDFNKLINLYKYLAKEKDIDYQEEMCLVLDSDNFEEKKSELIEDLSNGKRRFIISTYATIGAGQNLQYKIPVARKEEVVKLNNYRDNSVEMDIDGIYLDKPTYLVNKCGGDEENVLNRVFQMEYLCQVNAISQKDKMAEIVRSYISIDNEAPTSYIAFSNLPDVKVFATKTIVQAMGRKCRTNYRGEKIYILADSEIGDMLDKKTLFHEGRLFNNEMIKLAKQFTYSEDLQENRHTDIAKEDAKISNKRIQELLTRCFNDTWNDTDIKIWQNMRDYVLKHPTLSKKEWQDCPFRCHYITLGNPVSKYYYQQTGDFDSIHKISQDDFNGAQCVSMQDANLSKILKQFQKLNDFFINQGYATEFAENDYIMSPPLYQNIYKGALGEMIGKEIFKHYNIQLEELKKEEYEMFDYKVIGKPIYVDFKYWKESTRLDADEYRKKIKEKAAKCNKVETIIIANVRDTGCNLINETNMGTFNIIELSLIVNSGLSKEAAKKIETLK